MPRRGSENQANKRPATTAGGDDDEDRLSALPDPLLQHVLSFLPSRLAVRTCALARRWRHQWKSVPAVRVKCSDFANNNLLRCFVNHFLPLRDRAPLRECDIGAYNGRDIPPLILYALLFRVQVLRVDLTIAGNYAQLRNGNLVSEQLVRLELKCVQLEESHFLDFSSCPKLEVVKMDCCAYDSDILSQSLRHLSITGCTLIPDNTCARIFTPRLISLELADNYGLTPVLECMPPLATAFVRLGNGCSEYCLNSYYGDCGSDDCNEAMVHSDGSVLLDGLSNATNLELIADPIVCLHRWFKGMPLLYIVHFPKDLKKSPSFGKLKTLLLSEWCFADKFGALMYFLQHSPVLEKLSLELTTSESLFETHGSCYQREPFLASKHLKVVEVKYHEDEVFALAEVLKILITCGVPSKKIIIESMTSRISHKKRHPGILDIRKLKKACF